MRWLALVAFILFTNCAGEGSEVRYKWAFAQNMDGSFRDNELCRESLAQSLYDSTNAEKTFREANTNIFVFRGQIETYRIYGFKNQSECETALTNMKQRQRM